MMRFLLFNFLIVIDNIQICWECNLILSNCLKYILLYGVYKRSLQILKFLFQKQSHCILISKIMINIPVRLVFLNGINDSVFWSFSNWKIKSFSLRSLYSCCVGLLWWLIFCFDLLVRDVILLKRWTKSVLFDCPRYNF